MSSGFIELDESEELFEKTAKLILSTLEEQSLDVLQWQQVKENVSEAVSKFLYQETRRRPTVLTVLERV